jgi:hypothetical protein
MIPWPNKGDNKRPIQGPNTLPIASKEQPAVTKPKPIARPLTGRPAASKPNSAALDLGCL